MIAPFGVASVDEQITLWRAAASRASVYLSQESYKPRWNSVIINQNLRRGCGDAKSCVRYRNKDNDRGTKYAWVDPAMCFGCGACISVCPTGAIYQPLQSEIGLSAALESILKKPVCVDRFDE
jgi:NAD-dependent dihydropyrimidine dehydrogenase PreA subunit